MKKLLILLTIFFTTTLFGQAKQGKELSDFLPKGFVISETIHGDLNKDGIEDCVLIIKGTDKSKIIKDENGEETDRNRRGIVILFNKNNYYELAVKNGTCFSSENEDGGVYFAPELSIEIDKGKLNIRYEQGRYGYCKYSFRYQNSDFELIGYDSSDDSGPIVNRITSVNFLSKKKQIKENINQNAEEGEEVYKETWEKIQVDKLVRLSEIKNFDELEYYTEK